MPICLPKSITDAFLAKVKTGELTPGKLMDMSSAERREYLKTIVGDTNAEPVNALFESKVLLKNQQTGIINWAREVGGLKPAAMRDVVSKVNRMTKALTPESEKAFLNDLVAHKLGTHVTAEEAKSIADLAKVATDARNELAKDPTNKQLQIAYGNKYLDLIDHTNGLKPKGSVWTVSNVLNLPKSALTSVAHFSASFVQGWGMISTKEFWGAFGRQFKYFFDPQAYRDLEASIIAHPDYPLAKSGGLGLTHVSDQLSTREEAIQSSLLEHIPGLNKLVRASSRAFTGMLNDIRFSRFTNLLDSARMSGEDVTKNSQTIKDLASVVNNFTGRGDLPFGLDRSQAALNTAFFSPRKLAGTIQMFNPVYYAKLTPVARMAALRQISGSLMATGAMLELGKAMGGQVDLNPTSTNFCKIKISNTTFDPTGGNSIYIRLLARLITGKSVSGTGKETVLGQGYKPETRADLLLSFLRDKLSPAAGALANALYGTNPVGQKVTFDPRAGTKSEEYQVFVPIVMQDFINMATNDPTLLSHASSWLPSLGAVLGVSMESPSKSTSQVDWSTSTSQTMTEFKAKVGPTNFQKANDEFNQQYQSWLDQMTTNSRFTSLSQADQQSEKTSKKSNLEKAIMLKYGFTYKATPKN